MARKRQVIGGEICPEANKQNMKSQAKAKVKEMMRIN